MIKGFLFVTAALFATGLAFIGAATADESPACRVFSARMQGGGILLRAMAMSREAKEIAYHFTVANRVAGNSAFLTQGDVLRLPPATWVTLGETQLGGSDAAGLDANLVLESVDGRSSCSLAHAPDPRKNG